MEQKLSLLFALCLVGAVIAVSNSGTPKAVVRDAAPPTGDHAHAAITVVHAAGASRAHRKNPTPMGSQPALAEGPADNSPALASIYTDLRARAEAGDQRAACRLLKGVESCRRYGQFVAANGNLGPYERATTELAMAALDQKIFGMPMETAASVCTSFDPGIHRADSTAILRTARRSKDGSVALRAAIALQLEHGYDSENIRVVTERANAGDMDAVRFLAMEPMLPNSFYGKDADRSATEKEALQWLVVLKYVARHETEKKSIDESILAYQQKLGRDLFENTIEIAREISRKTFVEGSYGNTRERGPFSLDRDFCGG